ncbi:MAG: cytoplasmic protein [Syntrophales bacterium]|jgi:hypothetical protein|nr:cytoplasmic protein [Syntrophales bacterium]
MKQITIFAFKNNPLCFMHVLLNALDLHEKGLGGRIVFEGEATTLIPIMAESPHFLHSPYAKVKEKGLIDAVCRACSIKMGVLEAVEKEGLPIAGEMSGHPAMSKYIAAGQEIVVM